jgi:Glycosyltransferase family 87
MNASAHGETTTTLVCLLVMASLCLVCSFYYAFAIVPPAAALSGPGIVPDLYPVWYASRAVWFHHQNPYSREVTSQIQSAIYQGKRASLNEQRFAYPLFAVLLFAPFAALPFAAAQSCFLLLSTLLTVWSVVAWLDQSIPPLAMTVCVVLVLASFPVMLGLELRQPTMLVAALLATTVSCLRSGRLVSAGVLGALASVKPQLAIGVLLPLLVWSISDWRKRKPFLLSLWWTVVGLLGLSECLSHGWLLHWLATIRAYSHYAGAPPLIRMLPGTRLPVLAGALLIGAVFAASWKWRTGDPLLAIGFSISVLQVLLPFQLYNEVMLIPAVLWTFIRRSNQTAALPSLLRWSVWGGLGIGWVSTLVVCVANLINPLSIAKVWSLPIVIAWVFPIAVLAYLGSCASTEGGSEHGWPAFCRSRAGTSNSDPALLAQWGTMKNVVHSRVIPRFGRKPLLETEQIVQKLKRAPSAQTMW